MSLIPLLSFAIAILLMEVVDTTTEAMETGAMTEGVAVATEVTGATADTEVAAVAAAAEDTLVATEILGTWRKRGVRTSTLFSVPYCSEIKCLCFHLA